MALLLAAAVLLGCCGCSAEKEEAFRIIQVLEVSGSVSVERQTMGTMDAYEGMRLESGDKITVGADSWLKIKMDEDKYALVEPSSVLQLEASGSSADSKTVLHLEAGAVSNRLESDLGDGSTYEVNTPNSTMAVRGTVFRVEVSLDDDGVSVSNVSVYSGAVSSRLVYPDGTVDGEHAAVMIVDGTGVQMWGNSILSKYVTTDGDVALEQLQLETLNFLKEAYEAEKDLSVPKEELEELITALEKRLEPTQPQPQPTTVPTQPPEPETKPTEAPKPTTTPETEPYIPPTTKATEPPVTETTAPPTTAPVPEETTLPTESNAKYTVTFLYDGKTFATQTVSNNATAAQPVLLPPASGAWDFDFTTAITQDTTIEWKLS